jgi:hypothetical protein
MPQNAVWPVDSLPIDIRRQQLLHLRRKSPIGWAREPTRLLAGVRVPDEANENILLEFACSRIGFKERFGRLTSRRLNFGARIAVYLKTGTPSSSANCSIDAGATNAFSGRGHPLAFHSSKFTSRPACLAFSAAYAVRTSIEEDGRLSAPRSPSAAKRTTSRSREQAQPLI